MVAVPLAVLAWAAQAGTASEICEWTLDLRIWSRWLQELAPRVPDMATMLEEWVNRALQVRGGADWSAIAQFLVLPFPSLLFSLPSEGLVSYCAS